MDKAQFRFRPLNVEDLSHISGWLEDFDDVSWFERSLPVPVSKESVTENWKPDIECTDPRKSFWFLLEDNYGNPAGICGLQGINYIHGDAVIPVFVAKEYRNKGLAVAMIILLCDLAFGQLRLHRLSTLYRAGHEITEKLVACSGFVEEGRVREGWFAGGKHHDIVQVGMLKTEWEHQRPLMLKKLSERAFTVSNDVSAVH
ncbi:MAG: GNAT family protein [Pseudomonadota bacterium]